MIEYAFCILNAFRKNDDVASLIDVDSLMLPV